MIGTVILVTLAFVILQVCLFTFREHGLEVPVLECRVDAAAPSKVRESLRSKLGKHLLCEYEGDYWFEGPHWNPNFPDRSAIGALLDRSLAPTRTPGYFRIRLNFGQGQVALLLAARWRLPKKVALQANPKAIPLPLYTSQAVDWFQDWLKENKINGEIKPLGMYAVPISDGLMRRWPRIQ